MPRGRPFKKGHPGGPGRPKGSPNTNGSIARCKAWADTVGLPYLERLAAGQIPGCAGDHVLRAKVAEYLVDRGYGRPQQSHDLTSDGEPVAFTLTFTS